MSRLPLFPGMLGTACIAVTLCSPPATAQDNAAQADPINRDHIGCAHARSARAHFLRGGDPGSVLPPLVDPAADDADTDVLHYTLDIEVNLVSEWIGGSNLMQVEVLTGGLDTFEVRVADAFTIPVIRVNDIPVSSTRLDSATIEVTLDRSYAQGEQFDLYIEYEGSPYSRGFGSIEFSTHNSQPIAWTLSETWFAYTWWPCKDVNTDKATADFFFTVDENQVVASQGLLQSIDPVEPDKLRYHWKTDYPTATYLYSFVITNFNTFTEMFNYDTHAMPVEFFIYPEDDNSTNRDRLQKTVDMLGVFSDLYGLYPFINEKYGIAQFNWGGGMEHQTMTSQSSFSEWLSAHELAHQWWGDMITCATWHDIWLNEGFATYSEAIWTEFRYGQDRQALLDYMSGRRPSRVDGSVYVYDDTDFWRIFSNNFSYRKGAWVLHQLRHIVGDAMFFEALAQYRATYEMDAATTDDFIAVVESVWGDDLNWYFDPWVYEIGAPAYRFGWQQSETDGRYFIEVHLEQQQSASYPTYSMPVDVQTSVGSNDTMYVVWNDEDAEHLLFEVPGPIDDLDLDPEAWILATSNQETAFVEGPPKIVDVRPLEDRLGRTRHIEVVFHKDVTTETSDFLLVGDLVGEVTCTAEYDAVRKIATLTPERPLTSDQYMLHVFDTVEDVASMKPLDGELDAFRWGDQPTLPSGDGLPGGTMVYPFVVDSIEIQPNTIDGSNAVDSVRRP